MSVFFHLLLEMFETSAHEVMNSEMTLSTDGDSRALALLLQLNRPCSGHLGNPHL